MSGFLTSICNIRILQWQNLSTYALLPNHEQAIYNLLLLEIKREVPEITVRSISVDFEIALQFHLLKILKKQIEAAG